MSDDHVTIAIKSLDIKLMYNDKLILQLTHWSFTNDIICEVNSVSFQPLYGIQINLFDRQLTNGSINQPTNHPVNQPLIGEVINLYSKLVIHLITWLKYSNHENYDDLWDFQSQVLLLSR